MVEYKVRIEEPKSRNGHRTLPLDEALVQALTALRKRQLADSAASGAVYQAGLTDLDWYQGSEYLITDELGRAASHTRETTLACGDVARSEGLEPPTF